MSYLAKKGFCYVLLEPLRWLLTIKPWPINRIRRSRGHQHRTLPSPPAPTSKLTYIHTYRQNLLLQDNRRLNKQFSNKRETRNRQAGKLLGWGNSQGCRSLWAPLFTFPSTSIRWQKLFVNVLAYLLDHCNMFQLHCPKSSLLNKGSRWVQLGSSTQTCTSWWEPAPQAL